MGGEGKPNAPGGGPSRGRAFARGVAVSLVAVVLCLVMLELALRWTHAFGAKRSWSEPDSLIVYRYTPGATYWHDQENDHPITGTINAFGWRDRERSLTKPPGTYRIAFLGDSFVEAFQVEQDSTFLALAEDRLRGETPASVELMNFGRSGFTQASEYLVLKHDVMPFDPDAVAVVFVPRNDIADIGRSTAEGALRPFYDLAPDGSLVLDTSFRETREYRTRALVNPLKQGSALVSLLAERYNAFAAGRRRARLAAAEGEGVLPGYLTLCTESPESAFAENYRLNKAILRAMAEYCRARGVGFLLVCGDSVHDPEEARRYEEIDDTFDADFFDGDLRSFADSIGVGYLGLQEPFRRAAADDRGPLHWAHWSYAGHRVIAGEITEMVRRIVEARDGHRSEEE